MLTNVIEKNDIIISVKKNMDTNKQSNVQSLGQLIKTPKKSVITDLKNSQNILKH